MTLSTPLPTVVRRWALSLLAFGLLLGFSSAGGARPVRAQIEPPAEPTPTCDTRCEAEARAVRQACLDLGGTAEQCQARFRDTYERCMLSCQPEPTPATCRGRCELIGREAYERCIAGGGGADFCERQALEAREACEKRECEPTRTPTASSVDPTPATCEGKCAAAARQIYERCIASGRTPEACEAEAAAARQSCIRECEPEATRTATPTPKANEPTPATCRGRCELVGRQTYERCIAGGGGADFCERQAAEAREACEKRECEPTRTPTPGNNVEPTPATCEGRCALRRREVLAACLANGRGAEECEREADEARDQCLRTCERTATPTPRVEATPVTCEAKCGERARQAYEACIAAGRDPEACEAEASTARALCLRECPQAVEPTPGTANMACAERCSLIAREILSRCIAGGGSEERCRAESESARKACVASCNPTTVDPPAATTCAEKCEAHGRAVFARCRADGGPEGACRERSNAAELECRKACATQPGAVDCGARCAARGRDVELACLTKGEGAAVCARAGAAAEASCRLSCAPSPSNAYCATACRSLANVAYRRCVRSGGSFADCRVTRDRELAACIDRCLRDLPLRPTPQRP